MSKQKELGGLVEQLVFLKPEERASIVERFSLAPEGAQTEMLVILRQANVEQRQLMKKRVMADPDFPQKLEAFLKQSLNEVSRDSEQASQESIDAILPA